MKLISRETIEIQSYMDRWHRDKAFNIGSVNEPVWIAIFDNIRRPCYASIVMENLVE